MQTTEYPGVPAQGGGYAAPPESPAPGVAPAAPHEDELRGMLADLGTAVSALSSQVSVVRTRAEAYFAAKARQLDELAQPETLPAEVGGGNSHTL